MIKIANPNALILLGRDNDYAGQQRFDFEIIRMTYDDLLRRVLNIIEMTRRQASVGILAPNRSDA